MTRFQKSVAFAMLTLFLIPDAESRSSSRTRKRNAARVAAAAAQPAPAGTCEAGDFRPPIDNPRTTGCFGSLRIRARGVRDTHKGLDINGPNTGPGAQVKAIGNGKVRRAGMMGGRSGHTIIMDHPNCPKSGRVSVGERCVSVYRHLAREMKGRPGVCYTGGTTIGYVGRQASHINGGVPPHLHIEIVNSGQALNPAAFAAIVPSPGRCNTALSRSTSPSVQATWAGATPPRRMLTAR
jgi:murein DD-endopeptidase MepM/ murein hydrolase activator NlpD